MIEKTPNFETMDINELRTMARNLWQDEQAQVEKDASYLETMRDAVNDLERAIIRMNVYTKANNYVGATACAEALMKLIRDALKASLKL